MQVGPPGVYILEVRSDKLDPSVDQLSLMALGCGEMFLQTSLAVVKIFTSVQALIPLIADMASQL